MADWRYLDRKLKPLPLGPLRHQDSAIARDETCESVR
jgi:hypothetical protein